MSNISGDEGSFSSANTGEEVYEENEQQQLQNLPHGSSSGPSGACNSTNSTNQQQQQGTKKKRNLPGTPDPNAEVIALSPTTLMATNRFVCEICNKGFQRDQNLQLHRRGHNLPWKLKQRATTEVVKRVYVCPEPSCVHHNPARALGDLTGIKKHYSRKHGEKKWKCDKCSKRYAVQSDWKAHQKTCGTREYKCDCGTIFSRRDSFITHRAFCDALTEVNNRVNQGLTSGMTPNLLQNEMPDVMSTMPLSTSSNTVSEFSNYDPKNTLRNLTQELVPSPFKSISMGGGMFSTTSGTLFGGPKNMSPSSSNLQLSSNNSIGFNYFQDSKNGGLISGSAHMSATALLQKAAQMGATASNSINSPMMHKSFVNSIASPNHVSSPRPPYSVAIQQLNSSSYDHFNPHPDQSHMAGVSGVGAFTNNQLFQKGQQDISLMFDSNTTVSTMNDMGMFSPMFTGSDSNIGLMKNVEQEFGTSSKVHDFLGVGASTSRAPNLLEPQKQQQQRLELEAFTHQSLQVMNHFHNHLPHGD
ncbi:zinc finger protein GAI-ASSOCIATED FACTOR 1-like [Gastrolobium bilobum]|uniref:zinc finger protein GAI-ASSOCIATED FACTOR 1-like n=1 Tax=Gastrolobium bilobum TaxID=150636 RepID=UPI002AB137F2|nr:zinc finger protein GAI-ASSOCIATED FACTOR 1-like [Gastrolobium bilobum]